MKTWTSLWPDPRYMVDWMTQMYGTRIRSIEHQSPNLNALPRLLVLLSRVDKRGVRDTSGPPVVQIVIALDQGHLVRSLSILEVPAVVGIRLDAEGLASTVGVDQRRGDEVGFGNGMGVGNGQGVLVDCLDRTPYLDLC
jgi:hypothetical protein